MACKENELEEKLREVGTRFSSPPTALDKLLLLLDQTESLLSRVEQSPSQSMSALLRPVTDALVGKELFRHSDMDVKVSVASCISEITRITAPDAPYEDDLMKEVFQRIVEAFKKLDDRSSRSYKKRVSILETVAKVRSCVVMLDLECDDLILEMFHHFLKTIGINRSEKVFSSMATIMTLVLEESEDIPLNLLSCLLACVKRNSKDVLPITRKLAEKVIANCGTKLKPYLVEVLQSMDASLSDYSNVVAIVCKGGSEALEHIESDASRDHMVEDSKLSDRTISDDLAQGSEMLEPEVGNPKEDGAPADKCKQSVMSNGSAQIVKTDSTPESVPIPLGQKPDKVEAASVKSDAIPGCSTKNIRRQKSGASFEINKATIHSQRDGDKKASAVAKKGKRRDKESGSLQSDDPSCAETGTLSSSGPEKNNGLLPSLESENGTVRINSPIADENTTEATHPRKGQPPGLTTGVTNAGVIAVGDGHQEDSGNDLTSDEALASEDIYLKKETANAVDSEGKLRRGLGKRVPSESADADGAPATGITLKNDGSVKNDTETKHMKHTVKKGDHKKLPEGESSGKLKSNVKHQKGKAILPKDASEDISLKEMISSSKKMSSKDQSHLEESSKKKFQKQHAWATEETSVTETHKEDQDQKLVGARIKVWWPADKKFYEGSITSFDSLTKKHRVLYDDEDVETLVLKNERWELIRLHGEKFGGKVKEALNPDASSEERQTKRVKRSPDSSVRQVDQETPDKGGDASAGKSRSGAKGLTRRRGVTDPKPRGRPKGSSSNASSPGTPGKSKEEPGSKSQDGASRATEQKEEPDSDSKNDSSEATLDETPTIESKTKQPPKVGSKRKGSKLKGRVASVSSNSKAAGNQKDDAAGTANKSKKEKATAGSDAEEGDIRVDKGTVKGGRKRKDSVAFASAGKPDENAAGEKGKSRVKGSDSLATKASLDSDKGREGTLKRRKKGRC